MRAAPLLLALLLLPLAGCGAPSAGVDAQRTAGLDFGHAVLDVATTAAEAEPLRGVLRVAWSADGFAIESAAEQDLARRTLVFPGEADTTNAGMGWVRHDRGQVGPVLSNRLLLWDLRSLLEATALDVRVRREGTLENRTADGTLTLNGQPLEVHLWLLSDQGRILGAGVASPQGRESPFRFTPAGAPLGFPVAPPSPLRPEDEVEAKDTAAQAGHADLLQLIQSYANTRAGAVPDHVDPDTLRLELLASGKAWPTNPYDGAPQRDQVASGHFTWTKCGPLNGHYSGYGWDGALLTRSFGSGCPASHKVH